MYSNSSKPRVGLDKRVRTSKATSFVRYHFDGMFERLHLDSFFTKNDSIERWINAFVATEGFIKDASYKFSCLEGTFLNQN